MAQQGALRYDEDGSGRVEIVISGVSTGAIIQALRDIQQFIQRFSSLGEVISDPGAFFVQLHVIFGRFRAEEQIEGLGALIDVINESIPVMKSGEKTHLLGPVLNDLVYCLQLDELLGPVQDLLLQFHDDTGLLNHLRPEFESAILNSNDKVLIDAVKSVASRLPISSPLLTRRRSIPYEDLRAHPNQKPNAYIGSSTSPAILSNTGAAMVKAERDLALSQQHSQVPSPRALQLTFLPHSVVEQWLLAHNAEEVRTHVCGDC